MDAELRHQNWTEIRREKSRFISGLEFRGYKITYFHFHEALFLTLGKLLRTALMVSHNSNLDSS